MKTGDLTEKITWLRTRWFFIIFLLIVLILLIFETVNTIFQSPTQKSFQGYATKENKEIPNNNSNNAENTDLSKPK